MSSEDTAVNLKGTFAVKLRANNGLNRVAAYLNENRLARVPIVGYVEFQKVVETVDGDTMTVDLVAVEPAVAADGTDVKGWGRQTFRTLDEIRVAHGKGRVADTLFVNGAAPELDGQLEALTRGQGGGEGEVDESDTVLNASGDPVDPPSKEEIDAEKREAGEPEPGQLTDPENEIRERAEGVKTPGQKAIDAAVAANTKRTPRGPRTRPPAAADPFRADA